MICVDVLACRCMSCISSGVGKCRWCPLSFTCVSDFGDLSVCPNTLEVIILYCITAIIKQGILFIRENFKRSKTAHQFVIYVLLLYAIVFITGTTPYLLI